ncbi:pilus assembly protein FimV [Litorivivens lipolytica]|uniref:Pilus assembly protein FimV n=1 Tax=Litorivivens lipolytica TaxID=1524264 RepID=A0A7W4Z5U3_9GAMM|nr:FimV/HubP family polar landmark protein [Litorivivens lipolytica]MBB3046250.1 pilus assembly protein FimV [Litorivivens lipolytica]
MLKRSLAGAALIVGLGATSWSHALSMGDLRLNSALNQPLEARIVLRDTGNLSDDQITVKLASVEDFEKSGVDYSYLLSKLQFEVTVDGDGNGVVLIKSREPIVEPFLNFLVEARWPAGRMLREYTALLDLPVVSDARTSSVQAASGGAAAQAAAQTPATREEVVMLEETVTQEETRTGPKARDDRTALPRAERPTEYRVQHNDVLWEIATAYKPDGVTVQQTMLALLRKNPRAFIGDNINRLKSGYVLRLPTADEARELSQDSAVKEIRRQNAIWRGEALPSDGDLQSAPQLDATAREDAAAEETASPKSEARLSIATPGESASEGSDGEVQQLQDELAANQENLDKVQRENAELNSRLGDLERQLATLQRLLELKDDQLATLQQQMGAVPEQAESEVSTEESSVDQVAETAEQAEQTEPAEQEAEPAKPAPQPQPVAEPSLLDDPMLRYGAFGAALLALILLLLRRFGQKKTEADFGDNVGLGGDDDNMPPMRNDFDAPAAEQDEGEDDAGHTTLIIEPTRDAEPAAEADDNFDDFDALIDDNESDDQDDIGTISMSPSQVEAETDDALAEAEIYVAYGRYDQAAQMLSTAIAKEPERTDLRVKLLGVYLETRDQDKFIPAFRELEAMGDHEAIAEVKESMSAVEGVSDWLRDGGAAESAPKAPESAPVDDTLDDLDLDFDLDDSDEEDVGETLIREPDAVVEPATEAPSADADDLDASSFDLDDLDLDANDDDLSLGDTAERKPEEAPALDLSDEDEAPVAEPAGDDDLSFDLDLDDDLDFGDLDADEGNALDSSTIESLGSDDEQDTVGDLSLGDLDDDLDLGGGDDELSSENDDSDTLILTPHSTEGQAEPTAPESEPEPTPAPEPVKPADSFDDLDLDDFNFDEEAAADLDNLDEGDMSDDLGLLGDSDEVATKLDLARAYIDMGDADGAREMLQEVMEEGNDEQKQDANELLSRL